MVFFHKIRVVFLHHREYQSGVPKVFSNRTQPNILQANLSTLTVSSPSSYAAGNLMDADKIFTLAPQQRVIKDNEVTVTSFRTHDPGTWFEVLQSKLEYL